MTNGTNGTNGKGQVTSNSPNGDKLTKSQKINKGNKLNSNKGNKLNANNENSLKNLLEKSVTEHNSSDPDVSFDRNEGGYEALCKLEERFNAKIEHCNAQIEALSKVIESKDQVIAKLNENVGFLKSEVINLKTSLNFMSKETSDMKNEIKKVDDNCKEGVEQLNNKTTDLEDRSRRSNLVFFGVKELADKKTTEDCEKLLTEILLKSGIIDGDPNVLEGKLFDRAHRLGPRRDNAEKPRPIICKVTYFKDKEHILKNSYKLKNSPFNISEDFSKTTLTIRSELVAKAKIAKNNCKHIRNFRVNYRRLILKYEDPTTKNIFFRGFNLHDVSSNPAWYIPRLRNENRV